MAALSCQNFMRILKMFCTRIRIRLFLRMLMIHIRSPPAACWRNRVLPKVSSGLSRTRLSWEVFRNYRLHHHNNSLFKKAIIGIIIWDKIHKKMKTCHHHHQSCRRKLLSSEVKVSKEKPRLIIWFPGSFPISRLFGYKARNMMRDMGGVGFVAIQLSETETLGIFLLYSFWLWHFFRHECGKYRKHTTKE